MRSGVLLSLALGLFSAESLASPCIPQSGSSSVVTVSSAASTSVTSSELSLSSTVTETSIETETETSKATESSGTTETASSTESVTSETLSTTVSSADSTTLSTESTTAVSSTESTTSASTTESTSSTFSTSVSESATSGSTALSTTESSESSTSEAASTSSASVDPCATPNPNPAFKAVVQGSGGNQVMRSNGQHGSAIVLSTTADGYEPMAFTVEPCTNLLRQTNGKYVCVSYGTDDYFPPQIITCQLPTISWFSPVYCDQPVAGQPLVCHAQRGECSPGCRPKAGTPWSQFYSKASSDPFTPATLLHFGNSIAEGRPQSYTPVDFIAQIYSADPPAPTE